MKLLIATPAYGGMVYAGYLTSLIDTYSYIGEKQFVDQVGVHLLSSESLISRARNKCAKFALEHGFDKMLFIDADITWSPEWVEGLVKSGHRICGGTYPLKTFPITLNFNPLTGKGDEIFGWSRQEDNFRQFKKKHADAEGWVEVRHLPTGFMMIDVQVLAELAKSGKVTKYESYQPDIREIQTFYDFFPVRVVNGGYESEDWAFCSIARDAGYTIHLNANMVCAHTGTHHFSLGQFVAVGHKLKE